MIARYFIFMRKSAISVGIFQGGLTSEYKTEIVQNLVQCTPWTSVLVQVFEYIYFCGGIMKITFFNISDNFQCPIIFFWKMDMNSILNCKCKYERIVLL